MATNWEFAVMGMSVAGFQRGMYCNGGKARHYDSELFIFLFGTTQLPEPQTGKWLVLGRRNQTVKLFQTK